jgi:sugar O-acyltransferase (sialic acid O-acetyltransferase NeuD family)
MTKRLVIVGAGGFGRELHSWVKTSPEWNARWDVSSVVFVDDNLPEIAVRAQIISSLHDYLPDEGDITLCAIGAPSARRHVVGSLLDKGAEAATFIHDRAVVGDNVNIGIGTVICPDAILSSDVDVGEYVHINVGCAVGHDVKIGSFVTLSSACNLTGSVFVDEDAFLATAVTVIPGKRIGAGAFIGAASVVLKDVPPNVTVFGNPGVIVGRRPE